MELHSSLSSGLISWTSRGLWTLLLICPVLPALQETVMKCHRGKHHCTLAPSTAVPSSVLPSTSDGCFWCCSSTDRLKNSFLEIPFGSRGRAGKQCREIVHVIQTQPAANGLPSGIQNSPECKAKQGDGQSSLTTLEELTLRGYKTFETYTSVIW